MSDDVMRFYDGGGVVPRPVSPPDWVDDAADGWAADYEAAAAADEAADAVVAAVEVVPVPDVLSPDLDDGEKAARGLAVADDMPKDKRLRWWEIIAWVESCHADWVDRWAARPDVRGLAITHDRDVKDASTGELKKFHIHAMAGDAHGRKWSRRQALRFARDVFGLRDGHDDNLVRPIKSPSGYALYLTHANAPEKVQYPREAVMAFGGVDLDSVVGVVDNERAILADIYLWIRVFYRDHGALPAIAGLVEYANALRPSWARVLSSGRGLRAVKVYLTSYEYDAGLDGRGARTIGLVRKMIKEEREAGAAASGD